ncbi:unnamed protein product [Phytophthora lilii]|uniref:Unnamed protein product n=1 Tax=Phytophthora lilii TaxID=2077276 RepID=A0A9W6UC89_9STRA|nr:unnamed protein product [Phytophthora lilii]
MFWQNLRSSHWLKSFQFQLLSTEQLSTARATPISPMGASSAISTIFESDNISYLLAASKYWRAPTKSG